VLDVDEEPPVGQPVAKVGKVGGVVVAKVGLDRLPMLG